MAKKRVAKKQPAKRGPKLGIRLGALDQAAAAYKRLLLDPCNADMVGVPFAGTTSGYLVRTRNIITPSSSVDYIVTLQPGIQNATSGTSDIAHGGAATTGANVTGTNWETTFLNSGVVGSYRLVAGCIKLIYTGAELNRAGVVYGGYHTDGIWTPATGLGASCISRLNVISQGRTRLGSSAHEVRWLPNSSSQDFIAMDQPGGDLSVQSPGVSLGVIGAPAGTFSFEVIGVWEWAPDSSPTGTGSIVSAPQAPRSSSTLNDVLRSIGHAGEFVIEGLGGPKAVGNMAMQAVASYMGYGPVYKRMSKQLAITS